MSLKSVYESSRLWTQQQKILCHHFLQTESTNTLAKQSAFSDDEAFVVYLADQQTAGRGRGQHHWISSRPGHSLAITFKIRISSAPQPLLSPLIGLALFKATRVLLTESLLSLKPPNDLYLLDKKVAGLLIETIAKDNNFALIVGLGMNILSSPATVPSAGCLGEVSEMAWFHFLTLYKTFLQEYLPYGLESKLPQAEKAELLQALNAYPQKTSPYIDLTPNCDLITNSQMISWKEF